MKISSRAPGRICLFGEHQDYMGFPVIAAAIDLTIHIEGEVGDGKNVSLQLDDMNETLTFSTKHFTYTREKDYFKSAVRVLQAKGLFSEKSIRARVTGTIPIQAGTSSSSALVVAWIGFLLRSNGDPNGLLKNPTAIGELAYLSEVEEFNESGGRMDQYTSAIGGIIHIDFRNGITATPLPIHLREFVLGDSLQPKNTQRTLKRIRNGQKEGLDELRRYLPFKDPYMLEYPRIEADLEKVSSTRRPYAKAVLLNHWITEQSEQELSKTEPKTTRLADLMNLHHRILRDDLKISTQKIETMIDAAMAAGATAAKINGSGEGGCMFAHCPGRQEEVAEAIGGVGGRAYIINIGNGLESNTHLNPGKG